MSYIEGFLTPVPATNKSAYLAMAQAAASVFRECGALRVVEAWGDDLPDGQVTDFKRAVNAASGETTVFSWVEWPDKATREVGMKRFMEHPMIQEWPDMPFDGQRMIFGGFEVILEA
jgi:uncharacterized protein YbaA (DUF1428 family)